MARVYGTSSGNIGISQRIGGGCLSCLVLLFAIIGFLGIASLIYAST